MIGVSEDGFRTVLGLQSGDKESASSWREFFKDMKARGLAADKVQLGIMDGLAGLEKVFKEEFSSAKVQRCQVHVARNVIAKVPRKQKKDIADEIRSIFYASSKQKAKTFFNELIFFFCKSNEKKFFLNISFKIFWFKFVRFFLPPTGFLFKSFEMYKILFLILLF